MSTRNAMERQLSPAYQDFLKERQAELDEEKRQSDAAQAADPTVQAQSAMNSLALAEREAVLNVPLSEEYLLGERLNGREMPANYPRVLRAWADATPSFKRYMGDVLLSTFLLNDLTPTAENFTRVHEMLISYSAYPDEPNPAAFLEKFGPLNRSEEISESEARQAMDSFLRATNWRKSSNNAKLLLKILADAELLPFAENLRAADAFLRSTNAYPEATTYTRSDQIVVDHQKYCEEIIGHDESGKAWTMQMVDALPSKDMLRLLRLFELGTRGDSRMLDYMSIKDIQQKQAAERDRIAREEAR